jgi:ribosomal protein S3AE
MKISIELDEQYFIAMVSKNITQKEFEEAVVKQATAGIRNRIADICAGSLDNESQKMVREVTKNIVSSHLKSPEYKTLLTKIVNEQAKKHILESLDIDELIDEKVVEYIESSVNKALKEAFTIKKEVQL